MPTPKKLCPHSFNNRSVKTSGTANIVSERCSTTKVLSKGTALSRPLNISHVQQSASSTLGLSSLQDSIPTSLLKLSADNSSRAVKMFAGIQRYMDEGQEGLTTAQSIEIVQKLLHQGLKRPELKDELFMQLLKQSRGNPSPQAAGV